MTRIKHIHCYKRTNIGSDKPYIVFVCTKAGCTHYLSQIQILNKIAECPICGTIFTIDKKQARLARPHCDNCITTKSREFIKKQEEIKKLEEFLFDEIKETNND